MVCPRNKVELVIVVGMDSQDTANLISLGSMLATFGSTFFAWRQAIGSKKAKSEAEEQARRADESLKQMQQIVAEQQSQSQSQAKIAASLQVPEFELTNVGGTTFELHNVTMDPIKILEVVNIRQFVHRENLKETIEREFGPGEMVQVDLNRYEEDDNLRLRIEGRDNTLCIPIKRLRR